MGLRNESMGGTVADFLSVMRERGFIARCTDEAGLGALLSGGPVAGYVGFDATASSLHVGHLLPLMALRWFSATGNRAIALLGGATTLVGDPSFRNAARPMLDAGAVAGNARAIGSQVRRIAGEVGDFEMVDNAQWLGDATLIEFMRDVGSHFTVARMLGMESVRSRLSDGLSMLEFSYMLLQAADFAELARRRDCLLQLGGSDQWGNICNGIELARRRDGRSLFGLTTPLLETSSGVKMGKTAGGAVWLDAGLLDPLGFWQFWRNVEDADVGRFLAMFTELPMGEIGRLSSLEGREINEAKKLLATEVTRIVHGAEAALAAASRSVELFEGAGDRVATHGFAPGMGVVELLVELGFAPSRGAARRLIIGGAVRIDGRKIEDERMRLHEASTTEICVGRRRRALVRTEVGPADGLRRRVGPRPNIT